VGIHISSASNYNFIYKNSSAGQNNNFIFGAGNTYGPEVNATGALGTTGAAAHPWANFSINETP